MEEATHKRYVPSSFSISQSEIINWKTKKHKLKNDQKLLNILVKQNIYVEQNKATKLTYIWKEMSYISLSILS